MKLLSGIFLASIIFSGCLTAVKDSSTEPDSGVGDQSFSSSVIVTVSSSSSVSSATGIFQSSSVMNISSAVIEIASSTVMVSNNALSTATQMSSESPGRVSSSQVKSTTRSSAVIVESSVVSSSSAYIIPDISISSVSEEDYLLQCGSDCEMAPVMDGYTLYVYEEFNREITFGDKMFTEHGKGMDWLWTYSDGGYPGVETRFVKDNISFEFGKLILTQKYEPIPASSSMALNGSGLPDKKTSGAELRSISNEFHYGYYEVKMRVTHIQGTGNVFAGFSTYKAPYKSGWREIIFQQSPLYPKGQGVVTNIVSTEDLANDQETSFLDGRYNIEYPTNGQNDLSSNPDWSANSGEWHTYSFEWTPGRITWYIDGSVIRVYSENEFNRAGKLIQVPSVACSMNFNFWTPNFHDMPAEEVYPLQAEFDYFRYYKWNGSDFTGEKILRPII